LSARTALKLGVGAAGILVLAFALGEATGWPILVAPLERQLTRALDRPVRLRGDAGDARFEIRLLPAVRIRAEHVRVDAPAWSTTPHLLLARDLELELGYGDLFRAARGAPVHVRHLSAASLDARIERLADGRASWSAVGAKAEAVAALRRTTFGRGCVKTPFQARRAVTRVHRHIECRSRYAAIRREPGSAAGHAAA